MPADIARAEREARTILKTGNYAPPVDVQAIVSGLGLTLQEQPLEDTVSGMLLIRGDYAMIGVNQSHHRNRKRFTIAHELGHYILHREQSDVFVDAFLRSENSAQGVDPQEIEANTFAAELLMPKRLVVREVASSSFNVLDEDAITWLASKFGVSTSAMTIRLTKLGFKFA